MLKHGLILQRSFAAAAANAAAPQGLSKAELNVSKVPNGMTVASIDANGPIAHLVVTYRGGTRYEQPDEVGLVHRLRNSVGLDTRHYEGQLLVWQAGTLGASVSATATKDFFSVHMAVPRENAHTGLGLLGELSQPVFKNWDLEETNETLKYDLAYATPFDFLYDGIHRAAYRSGSLANPLLTPSYRIGKYRTKDLLAFQSSHLVNGEAAIFGFNMDHDKLIEYGEKQGSIQSGKTNASAKPSPYVGGEDRVATGIGGAHVVIVGEGGKLSDPKSIAVQAVLAAVIGQGPNSKFTSNAGLGAVARAVHSAANRNPVGISALNILHSDSGLVGVYLNSCGTRIEPYVHAAIAALKQLGSGGPNQEDLEVAKKVAAANVLIRAESGAEISHDTAAQLLVNGNAKPISSTELAHLIEGVSGEDVKKAAAKLTAKLSIASYGTIDRVPLIEKL